MVHTSVLEKCTCFPDNTWEIAIEWVTRLVVVEQDRNVGISYGMFDTFSSHLLRLFPSWLRLYSRLFRIGSNLVVLSWDLIKNTWISHEA